MGCAASTRREVSMQKKANANQFSILPSNFVKFNSKEFAKVYSVGRSLGTGSFGEVRFCTHIKSSSKRAVKIFKKEAIASDKAKKQFQNEVSILKVLDHPNIVRVYEFFEDFSKFYIVMEQCRGGELFDDIIKSKKYTEQQCAQIMKQLFSCISYLHSIKICHRDLKPENILFNEKLDYHNIKLVDFGSASFFTRSKKMKGSVGTPYYVAPEVLTGSYSEKCDV